MRKALTLAIGMLFATSGVAFSAEKAVNTICPNCGCKGRSKIRPGAGAKSGQ